jgi:small-conductance mechanosensitive channel
VRLIVAVIAIAVIVSVVFEESITGFLAASGVVGLVLGFALRNMIADFFQALCSTWSVPLRSATACRSRAVI